MAILNGTDVKVYDSGTGNLVAFAQNGSLTINHSLREITNKESAGFKESLEGLRDWSIDLDGAYAWTDASGSALTNGADDVLQTNVLNARQSFTVKFGNVGGTTGDIVYSGSAFITSWSATAGTEDTATYSISLEGTGTLTQTVS